MNTKIRFRLLIIALALVAGVNGLALSGVALNRSGPPHSIARLTQRELPLPYSWRATKENSGLALRLDWRILPAEKQENASYWYGAPAWLDRDKMVALGFNVPDMDGPIQRHRRQLSREVLLVLELDGPASAESLRRAREHAAAEEALLQANPEVEEFVNRARNARQALERERDEASRLFVVDAGLDRNGLRKRYPDRSQYLVVRGRIRPSYGVQKDGTAYVNGHILGPSITAINVPLRLRPVFDPQRGKSPQDRGYSVTVAWGSRLEPWIVEASASP